MFAPLHSRTFHMRLLRGSSIGFSGPGSSLIWSSGFGILEQNRGEFRDWKYAWEVGCQNNSRDYGIARILGRDYGIEEPFWGPSLNLVSPSNHYSVSRGGSVLELSVLFHNRTSCFRLVLKTPAFNSTPFQRPVSIIKSFDKSWLRCFALPYTGRKNGSTRVAKLQQMCSKYHICTILLKFAQEQRLMLH